MLAETIVAMVLLGLLITGTLRMNAVAAEALLNRETLENMAEIAGDYLNEAKLGDCTPWRNDLGDPWGGDIDHYCYAPIRNHYGTTYDQAASPSCPNGTGNGVNFVLERNLPDVRFEMNVTVLDCYDEAVPGGTVPVRIVTVTGNSKTLERASVGVASP